MLYQMFSQIPEENSVEYDEYVEISRGRPKWSYRLSFLEIDKNVGALQD